MFSCSNCAFWIYRYPHRLGVCTAGPDRPDGTVAPISAEGVGMLLAIEHAGETATGEDTICYSWEPDETVDLGDDDEDSSDL